MSITNGDAGLVLTMIDSFSPARRLVREQYPSIHGHRYLVLRSTRVLVSNQSFVPSLAFSVLMRSDFEPPEAFALFAALSVAASDSSSAACKMGPAPATTPAASAHLSKSLR